MLAKRLAFLLPLVLFATGCPSTPSDNDAGDVATDMGGDASADDVFVQDVVDVPQDVFTPTLYSGCASDADCPAGGTCLTEDQGYPGGFCTKDCTTEEECDPGVRGEMGTCQALPGTTRKLCQRFCLNGPDCSRAGYTCIELNHTYMINACVPSCTDATCGSGTRCNLWSSECEPTSTPYPPAGADNGQACGSVDDCKGTGCTPERNSRGTYTGYNGGYCTSDCALPSGWNPSTFYAGSAFPQSNCPAGSICVPAGNNWAEQDPGICLAECSADSDCRVGEGYYCRRRFTLATGAAKTFSNGWCSPVDCLNDTAHPCPTGYACETHTASDGTRSGVCKPAPVTDAGGPDVVDSGSTDAGESDAGAADVIDTDVIDTDVVDDVQVPADVDLGDASLPDVLPD